MQLNYSNFPEKKKQINLIEIIIFIRLTYFGHSLCVYVVLCCFMTFVTSKDTLLSFVLISNPETYVLIVGSFC